MKKYLLALAEIALTLVLCSQASVFAAVPPASSPNKKTIIISLSFSINSPNPIEVMQNTQPTFDDVIARLKSEQAQEAAMVAQQAIQQRMDTYYPDTYTYGNCTAYVASQRGVPNWWGNADTWAYYAQQEGWDVTNQPIIGAIAQTTAGWAGHVALVTGVESDSVMVKEMNVEGLGVVDTQDYPTQYFKYIY